MSKVKIYPILINLILSVQTVLLSAEVTPTSTEGYEDSYSGGTYTDFVETTYDDPNWVLVISDVILREDYCSLSGIGFDKVFEPCFWIGDDPRFNRYWKLEPGAETARAFPMSAFGRGEIINMDSSVIIKIFIFLLAICLNYD